MPSAGVSNDLTLTVNGKVYTGWTQIRVERGIDRVAAHFDIGVTERWGGKGKPWQIRPFDSCTVKIGADLVLTGYVDVYGPSYSADDHTVRIVGRSKTEDLIDCEPDIPSGQFHGYRLDQIARALCVPFGIGVVIQADMGEPFDDATIQRHETAFCFLERLCRLRSVLACDDEQGRLVLTVAGGARAKGALQQGQNILSASARLDVSRRFSIYKVKTQMGEAAGGAGGLDEDGAVLQSEVVAGAEGTATDPAVPRYRPHVVMAETGLNIAGAGRRADWQMRYAAARATEARVQVHGWRQPDGTLWRINQLVTTTSPFLQVDADLLISCVAFSLSERGSVTELTLGPVDAFTPSPAQVKIRKGRRGKPSAASLSGFDEG